MILAAVWLPVQMASAQVMDTFYNNTTYTASGNINATNFWNDSSGIYSMTPALGSGWLADLYQSWIYTRNFTNNGEMDCFTGFRFDRNANPGHVEANSFFNTGNINCGTSSNAIFIINGTTISIGGYGGMYVWATNIYNSGTITVGADGLGRFFGNNLDIDRGTITMENSFLESLTQTNTSTVYATGQAGNNTNSWFPDVELLPTTAQSALLNFPSPLPTGGITFNLANSQPYFSVVVDAANTNVIIRMVFLQNDNTNTPYNVYFGSGFGNGFATVEWVGSYVDPSSGNPQNNYLYLTDDYNGGSSTNILQYTGSGVPFNFGFVEQSTPAGLGVPTPSNYPSIFGLNQPFPPGVDVKTNIYVYMDASLVASTVSTNQVQNHSITNLPGRFELIASNELNLSQAAISGMNYLLLRSTNNFDNDGASVISSPYTDMYLGRTNGTMVLSNLLLSAIPVWNGTVQAWNTRWIYSDTNSGYTFDYRALLVESSVTPTSGSQQQDVMLYSSNNISVYDDLNITRTFFANCTNLLVAYSGNGAGVNSVEGQLNMSSPSTTWAAATPRLQNLTNNGVISTVNQAVFGTTSTPYLAIVNTGVITNVGAVIYTGDLENSGVFSEIGGTFEAHGLTSTMSGGGVITSGTYTNAFSSIVISNTTLSVGKSIALVATNLLTDYGTTSNYWVLGSGNGGSGYAGGLIMPVKPATGDLLGTSITNFATSGTLVGEIWAGQDRGAVNAGFVNNEAIGQMIFDAAGSNSKTNYYFNGASVSNAMYIDCIVLQDSATNTDASGNYKAFGFNTNLVIYYAQALNNNVSVAEKLNHKNNDHFRWVPSYVGYFSSTNIVGPPGVTNLENAALAVSPDIDSDGDGSVNAADSSPFFVPQMINFTIGTTSTPPKVVKLTWQTPPLATNYVYYTTNLLQPWQPFNAFGSYYWSNGPTVTAVANTAHTNWFISPQAYSNPATNVWVFDAITNTPHFYRIVVQPNLLFIP